MKTIEKYILKETLFFSTISTIVVSILMILIVFLNSLEETKLDIEQILYTMLYSIFKLGEFSSVILSLGCILGIITVINIMNKNFEIITIKNFGISDLQILKPFLITGTIFSLIALLFSFYISPYMLSKAKIILYTNIKKEEGLKRLNPVDSWIKNENFICNIFYYDTTRNSAFGLKCIEIKDKITGYITIDRADWIDGWIAKNVRMWDDKSKEIKKLTSLNEINHILPKPKYLSKQFKDIEELNL
ncbi:MAG: LptF/LptG family permease, partial [Thermosulfidibacteraceae bacterium]